MNKQLLKRSLAILSCLAMLFLCACGSTAPAQNNGGAAAEVSREAAVLTEIAGATFEFCSGAGGWSTDITIAADGSFEGYYHDSEMGETGEDYPNGSVYCCSFTGKLGNFKEIDDKSFSFAVESLKFAEPGSSEINEGIRFETTKPYGISEGSTLVFYRAGSETGVIPENLRLWLYGPGVITENDTTLPVMIIVNEKDEAVFCGYPADIAG